MSWATEDSLGEGGQTDFLIEEIAGLVKEGILGQIAG